ncbi:MAG: glycosyltransferase, partial [Clostridia bacterium]|nr:glycosyltransferase [Clostridia bacterium]
VVSFSTSETQGLTIIEGLSAGKPTLCINDICFRQVIENGYNGYLFKDGDEFIDLVLKLVRNKNKYEEMSLNAENSTYRYSREVFGAEVLKIYNRAIENKKNKE